MNSEVLSKLKTALVTAATGAILTACPGQPEEPGPEPDEEVSIFEKIDVCVREKVKQAPRPTLSGALRFPEIMDECPGGRLQGERNGVKFDLCGARDNWGRVEGGPEIQARFSHCQGIAGIDLPVDSFSVYLPSGVVYLRDGNRHGLIDLREDISDKVNFTDQRKISACAFQMVFAASYENPWGPEPPGDDLLPNGYLLTDLYDCLGDSLPPDNPSGDKLPFVWHNIP
ncbi:MAG: hypothetical protein M3O22_03890 [Pseudomonadota bacterium]|nr:hypothetical protein [Pseudomonadota bacterium]